MPMRAPVHRPYGQAKRKPFANSRTAAQRLSGRKLQERNMWIKVRDLFTCQGCNRVIPARYLQVDHVTPLAQGGTEDDGNLQSLCITGQDGGCHGAKTRKEAADRR